MVWTPLIMGFSGFGYNKKVIWALSDSAFSFSLFVICLDFLFFLVIVFQISTQKPFYVFRYRDLLKKSLGGKKGVEALVSFMCPQPTRLISSGQMALCVLKTLLVARFDYFLICLFWFFFPIIFPSTKLHIQADKFNKSYCFRFPLS